MPSLYLPGVEADPKPGAYRTLIEAARGREPRLMQFALKVMF